MENIIIALTDDDNLITGLLEGYLKNVEGFEVVFTAQSGEQLLEKLKAADKLPEILLLDLKMGGMDGVEVTEYLKEHHPEIKVVVVSSHYQKSFMGFMLRAGVSAFLPKGISPAELVTIIKAVHRQGFYFMEGQLNTLRGQITGKAPRPALQEENLLSERETEVLKLICQQKTAKEIGDILFITQRTAEGHKNNLFVKTGAKNIAGLVIYAIQNNVIQVDELPVI